MRATPQMETVRNRRKSPFFIRYFKSCREGCAANAGGGKEIHRTRLWLRPVTWATTAAVAYSGVGSATERGPLLDWQGQPKSPGVLARPTLSSVPAKAVKCV